MKNNNSMAIKSRFSNRVHKLVNPYYGVKNSKRYTVKPVKLTDEEKARRYDQIVLIDQEASRELSSFFFKRRYKKRIYNARVKRGYNFNKKVKLSDHKIAESA